MAMDLASPRLMVILAKSCSVLWWGQKISESKWGSRAIRIVLNLLELIDHGPLCPEASVLIITESCILSVWLVCFRY